MSVKANPADAAAKWVSGMQSAGPRYSAGIDAVKVAPGQLASAKADFWASQVAQAKPKFASNVAKVSLGTWQEAAKTKGAPRLGSGAAAAQPKFVTFMTNFLPQLSSIVSSLPPSGTFEANMARSMAFAQALHSKQGSF